MHLVISFLESKGYIHTYFSQTSPFTLEWDIGTAICSKILLSVETSTNRCIFLDHLSATLHNVFSTDPELKNPTWWHNTWKKTPLRANLERTFWSKGVVIELTEFKFIDSDELIIVQYLQYLISLNKYNVRLIISTV
jgi:hypothetical protein